MGVTVAAMAEDGEVVGAANFRTILNICRLLPVLWFVPKDSIGCAANKEAGERQLLQVFRDVLDNAYDGGGCGGVERVIAADDYKVIAQVGIFLVPEVPSGPKLHHDRAQDGMSAAVRDSGERADGVGEAVEGHPDLWLPHRGPRPALRPKTQIPPHAIHLWLKRKKKKATASAHDDPNETRLP